MHVEIYFPVLHAASKTYEYITYTVDHNKNMVYSHIEQTHLHQAWEVYRVSVNQEAERRMLGFLEKCCGQKTEGVACLGAPFDFWGHYMLYVCPQNKLVVEALHQAGSLEAYESHSMRVSALRTLVVEQLASELVSNHTMARCRDENER